MTLDTVQKVSWWMVIRFRSNIALFIKVMADIEAATNSDT